MTITYPPPGTPILLNPDKIIYYGQNIVSDKGQGSVIVIAGGKFVVTETPEVIAQKIKQAEAAK